MGDEQDAFRKAASAFSATGPPAEDSSQDPAADKQKGKSGTRQGKDLAQKKRASLKKEKGSISGRKGAP